MASYILSITLSAFLVFQVQPLVARAILPWFGGTPAVWSTVMLFFQAALTGGYAYAYCLVSRVPARRQHHVHLLMLLAGVLMVIFLGLLWPSPVTPGGSWKPIDASWPVPRILAILAVAVGMPFFTLAATSPLLQAWTARTAAGRSPYWLYAVSNAGSLVALLSYPVFIEPTMTVPQQGWAWTVGYLAFAVLTGAVALRQHQWSGTPSPESPVLARSLPSCAPITHQVLWLLLSAVSSMLLLAVTSHTTQEVAVIPLLWVVPLATYLLTFTIAFSSDRCYHRVFYSVLLALTSAVCIYLFEDTTRNVSAQITGFVALLFSACMVMHGELYRLRPDPVHLTRFYLTVSLGGALGGMLVTLVFPSLCNGYWELPLSWAAVWALLAVLTFVRPSDEVPRTWRGEFDAVLGGLAITVAILAGYAVARPGTIYVASQRNFYGILRVKAEPNGSAFTMVHGATRHGSQFVDASRRRLPTTYFARDSGIGLAITHHPKYGHGLRLGVLGLGVGTLAAYGQPGDSYRFYEINPLVAELAHGRGGYFSFLADTAASVQVVLGDARISLERELAEGRPQRFDVLAIDVFSSDAIPVHLITREAFGVYLSHLAPGGVIAAHISNKHLDLTPVLWQIARAHGLKWTSVRSPGEKDVLAVSPSLWVLMARDSELIHAPTIRAHGDLLEGYSTNIRLWTDDYSNLFEVLR